MRSYLFLVMLVVAVVVAFQLQQTEAKFSFSLPGRWGGAKRGSSFSFSLPGRWGGATMGKRSEELGMCGKPDEDAIYTLMAIIQAEAIRINDCLSGKGENDVTEKH